MMFLYSGVVKVATLGSSEGNRFNKRTGLPPVSSKFIVFLAGCWELFSIAFIIDGVMNERPQHITAGCNSLILFTIFATLIFYVAPLKIIPALANLSVIGGLLLLPMVP